MASLLQICQLGHPVLRCQATPIEDLQDAGMQKLIDDLIATVISVNGVGIAAPQVAEPFRVFIVASHPSPRYPNAPNMQPTAMINPRILSHSDKQVKDWEGCLSIPGIRGLVPRYTAVEVEYLDCQGKLQKHTFRDFIARIVQHEQDHLEGIVFLDRLETTKDIVTEQEYQKLIV
ncbi:MAG TPA: peptide deformylase [Candidatus Caenarcaniphilales bacterium]